MLLNYWWVPCAIVMYSLYAWLTKQNNVHHTPSWFWYMWLVGAIPLWNWVSRHSKALLTDGFLYDLVIILSYVVTLIILGEAKKFVFTQYLGLVLCLLGIVLMKCRL